MEVSHAAATSCSPHDVPQGVVASRPFLSSLFSSYPPFSFLSISFLDIPVPPNACCACVRACLPACVRELKFAQRGYGYITRRRPSVVVVNIQLRGNVAPRRVAFLVYVIAAVASREPPCAHVNTYTFTYGTHRTY